VRPGGIGRGRAASWLLLAALCASAAACGRYGPPIRAEEYRERDKQEQAAEAERRRQSPQSTNEPLPAAP
jgi:hypothetical protein